MTNNRVVVAMSGGVDSSVCAWLLKRQGYDPVGVTIQTWSSGECRDERSKGCCSLRDIDDARSVARKLGIPHYVMDLSADFKARVVDNFIDEYLRGRTPNPCIECNRHIKFGVLLGKAAELEASHVATGHYARSGLDPASGRRFIREGADPSKDQSYVLFGLSQAQLERTLLPVGELTKTEVRDIARGLDLRVSDKPDSQEICFVPKNYTEFVEGAASSRLAGEGELVGTDGTVLGIHGGSHRFTVGQRKRIRVTAAEPYYVTGIDGAANRVTVGRERELYRDTMDVARVNWMLPLRTGGVSVKIRYRHPKTPAEIVSIEEGGARARVRFAVPQKAVTPGQIAVFYEGDRVLGGGWIE